MRQLITFLFAMISMYGYTQNKRVEPAYVIDGVVKCNIRDINPDNLFDFSLTKGAQDTVKYGSNAKYGVALITTCIFARKEIGEKLSEFSASYEKYINQKHFCKITYILNDSAVPERTIFYLPKEKIKNVIFQASVISPEIKIKSGKFILPKEHIGQVYIRGN